MTFKKKKLILIGLILIFVFCNSSYGWLADFEQRKEIKIQNTDTDIYNYTIFLTIEKELSMLDTFADIRFYDYDSVKPYNYWISAYNNTHANIYVRIDDTITTTTNTTLYMYYGNLTAVSSQSNPYNAFIFYDDCESADFSRWSNIGYTSTLTRSTNQAYKGTYSCLMTQTQVNGNGVMEYITSFDKLHLSGWIYDYNNIDNMAWQTFISYDENYEGNLIGMRKDNPSYYVRQAWTNSNVARGVGWHKFEAIQNGENVKIYIDNVEQTGVNSVTIDRVQLGMYYFSGGGTNIGYFDEIQIKKHLSTPPIYSFGDEETATNIRYYITQPIEKTYTTSLIPFEFKTESQTDLIYHVSVKHNDNYLYYNDSYMNNTIVEFDYYYNQSGNILFNFNATDSVITTLNTRNVELNLYDFNITFSNYNTYDDLNYTQSLIYDYSAYCGALGHTALINITSGNIQYAEHIINCDGVAHTGTGTITTDDGARTITTSLYEIDNTTLSDYSSIDVIFDNTPPNTEILYNISYGFVTSVRSWVVFNSTDTISPITTCNLTYAGLTNTSLTFTNTTQNMTYDLFNGVNPFIISCSDIAGNTATTTKEETIYYKEFIIINEDTGGAFTNWVNMTTLNVVSEVTNQEYNFLSPQTTSIKFLSNESETIRINKKYVHDEINVFFMDFDLNLLEDSTRVCVPRQQTFYEQLFYSYNSRDVAVYNIYARCYVLASTTKYLYGGSLSARAFTKDGLYYLYTYDNGRKIYLTSIDGAQTMGTNLDVLEFNQKAYNIGIKTSTLSISDTKNDLLYIYYRNTLNDNNAFTINILNGTTLLYSITETDNPNDFNLYLNTSLIGVDSNAVLRAEIIATKTDGTTETQSVLFTIAGNSGILNPTFALIIAFMLMMFGFTFTAVRITFGYFGLLLGLFALGVLSLAPATITIRFMQVMIIIILIFIGIIIKNEGGTIE